jgi:hypothetical protein
MTKMRWWALLAVCVLHALFLHVIQRMRRVESRDALDAPVVMIQQLSRVRELQRPRETERVQERSRERIPPVAERAPPVNQSSVPESSAPITPPAPRAIDWHANAVRSAQVIVQGSLDGKSRSFGSPRQPERPARPPQSVFGPGPKHRAGDVGSDTYDDPVVWINDHCYKELEKPVPTARDFFRIMPLVKCMWPIGKREPKGKLFEHIRKPEEPPAPQAGTEMNALPERSVDE